MKILALAGGVGGAKLVAGLSQVLPPENLSVVVNNGDDFEYLGLYICPDLDTVCYTLAGISNSITGWGRDSETWQMMQNLTTLGGPDWFRIGDQDIATHIERTRRLKEGNPLSKIVREFCRSWQIDQTIFPMSDQIVRTVVATDEGILEFQEYFVHRQCRPHVTGFNFPGIKEALPAPGVFEAIDESDAIVICPSNPWVSIGPIIKLPGMESKIKKKKVIAISPIIGGQAVKGPAAKMYKELGIQPSAFAVAQHYQSLINGFVMDKIDREQRSNILNLGIQPLITDTLMKSPEDRKQLAKDVLNFIGSILQ
jgi:LPPG:FO 2-phospho-L-lactate transferase